MHLACKVLFQYTPQDLSALSSEREGGQLDQHRSSSNIRLCQWVLLSPVWYSVNLVFLICESCDVTVTVWNHVIKTFRGNELWQVPDLFWLLFYFVTICEIIISAPLDNIWVMVIVWRLRGNIIRTAPCWVVWHNVAVSSTLMWAVFTGPAD